MNVHNNLYTYTNGNVIHLFRFAHSRLFFNGEWVMTLSDNKRITEGAIMVVIDDINGDQLARFFPNHNEYRKLIDCTGLGVANRVSIEKLKDGAKIVTYH